MLLTDGEDNVSEAAALEAAKNAAKAGLKIFTIGIGTAAGDLIRVTDANGNSDYVRDAKGNVVKSHLNEPLLQQIAGVTGGFYLPLRGANTMDTLYERGLAPLPKSEGKGITDPALSRAISLAAGRGDSAAAGGNVFAGAETNEDRNIQHPTVQHPTSAIVGHRRCCLEFCCCQSAPGLRRRDALRDYQSGNYTNALQEFEQLAEMQTNDLRLVFNAGDAAYRATNFDLAQSFFQQVTLSPDLKLQQQAFYNLGNAQFQTQ